MRGNPHDRISALRRKDTGELASSSCFLLCEDTMSRYVSVNPESALNRHQICHHLDLGLASLQKHEKSMFAVSPILW